jgi:hypothetical protein
MKPLWLIRNRRGQKSAPRVSLFPFLAVLICTMGALMLLLLFVSRQARLQAAREAAARDAEKQSSINSELEMVQWRVDQLKKSRQETAAQMAEARLVLGHVEDHTRRLRDQFQELTRQAKKAADEGLQPGRFVAAGEGELRQIEGQIALAQQQLELARRAVDGRPKSYAIVPYEGPNHTRRRPIYIECRGDAVVLQPENIAFDESDFDEPLGPGNPLAAAVRAAREQMLLQGNLDPQNGGEPYPLLLVRPSGILAYECALAAMQSWGSEFGYELINEGWQLKYPPPDPNVAKAVQQAMYLARQEHARLIAAAPSTYGKRPRLGSYRSSTGDDTAGQGGGGGEGGGSESPGFYSNKPSDRYAQNGGGGGGSSSSGRGGGSGSGRFGTASDGEGSGGGEGSGPASDADFAAKNPYAALAAPGVGPGGVGTGIGFGGGNGSGGAGGPGMAGSPGMGPGGVGTGSGYGAGNGMGGVGGAGYVAGNGVGGVGGAGYVAGNGVGGGGSGFASGTGGSPGTPGSPGMGGLGGTGSGYGAGNDAGGGAGSGFGMAGSPGAGQSGSGQGGAGTGFGAGGSGTDSGNGAGNAAGGIPSVTIGGNAANAQNGNPGGTSNNGASNNGAPNNYAPSGSPTGMQPNGQLTGGSPGGTPVARPDGYIDGRPTDGNPPPVQPPPPSNLAMAPAVPLRPGEWREETPPPKPDPEAEAKEKKKHPYDKVKIDRDQDDWALRNSTRHAAAISRPIHVDCYPDRIVLKSEADSEPRVVLFNNGPRDGDKVVAAVWEIMDTWGMAGREMYWRPVLHFYVVPGAEPRLAALSRSLQGSGLVIERKQ